MIKNNNKKKINYNNKHTKITSQPEILLPQNIHYHSINNSTTTCPVFFNTHYNDILLNEN
jgi:hypothetical protein